MADLDNYPCNAFRPPSYVESDLLETNIKEIEYTLFKLMDNEKEQYLANKNNSSNNPGQRISFSSEKLQQPSVKNKRNFLDVHHGSFDLNNNNRKYVSGLANLSNHSNEKLTPLNSGHRIFNPDTSCSNSNTTSPTNLPLSHAKKSVKMSVPSNKRQILEEEFRKEKYPCNEKLQKLCSRLNMKYDEVQNYFKKRRREEKETNNKFSNLVKLLNNYLEQNE